MAPHPNADVDTSGVEPDPTPPPGRAASLLPKLAVVAVAGAAVAAAFMSTRGDPPQDAPMASAPPPPRQEVVRAPPLVVTAPPLKPPARPVQDRQQGSAARGPTTAMGASAACGPCGVVESVVAAPPGAGFEMRIRMDDGSLRKVEQRGAVAAGTRVWVEGGSVRPLPG